MRPCGIARRYCPSFKIAKTNVCTPLPTSELSVEYDCKWHANGNISVQKNSNMWTKGRTGSVEMTWQASFHVYLYTPRVNDTCHGTIGGFKSNGQRRHIKPGGNACATIPVTRSSIVKLNVLLARYSIE